MRPLVGYGVATVFIVATLAAGALTMIARISTLLQGIAGALPG